MTRLPAIRHFWDNHWKAVLIFWALVVVLVWVLALTQSHKLVEDVWTVKLADCNLDYHTHIHAVALACPGVDYIKLWPLPVVQPWQSTPDPLPDPWPGGYARRFDPAR